MARADGRSTVSVKSWLDALRAELPAADLLELTGGEQEALLDLARVAAHTSERIAAPLSTFLAGVALHDVPAADRESTIRALTASLERDAER